MSAFARGASYLVRGMRWLPRPQLRRFVIIPLLINVVLFGVVIWWGAGQFADLMNWVLGILPNWDWLSWLRWLLWPLFGITVLVVSFSTFTLIANFIASPFNGLLSQRVAAMAGSEHRQPTADDWWQELAAAPWIEIKKLFYFVGWGLLWLGTLWLITLLMPPLGIVSPFLWWGFSAWMLALGYVDYPMANHGIGFTEQRTMLSRKRILVIGFGSAVLLMTMIPGVNLVVVPAAVIGATLMWVEHFADESSTGSSNA